MKAEIKDLARKCQVLDLSLHSLPHCVCMSSVDLSKNGQKRLPEPLLAVCRIRINIL